MLNLIDQYRCYPTAENARRLQDLFERYPSRIWALQSEDLRVLTAAGVGAAEGAGYPAYPSNPRPSAAAPTSDGRFITTKPARSRCSTSRLATISAMISSALCTRLRPW